MGAVSSISCCSNELESSEVLDIKAVARSDYLWAPEPDSLNAFSSSAQLLAPPKRIHDSLSDAITSHVRAAGAATLTFDAGDGASRDLRFTKAPLGIYFRNSTPIEITRLSENGEGRALGVRSGWRLTHIEGYPVDSVPFDDTLCLLRVVVSALPRA